MAKFVPFILRVADDSPVGVKIVKMKNQMPPKRRKNLFGRQAGCPTIFRIPLLKSMP